MLETGHIRAYPLYLLLRLGYHVVEYGHMAEAVVTEQTCPSCSSVIPVHKGYVAWCERCGWNLQPQQAASPTTLFESLYLSVGKGANERLFTAIQHAESLRPSLTPLKAAALAVAAAIYGLALAVALCGTYLLVTGWPHIGRTIEGLVLVVFSYYVRPRVAALPATILRRGQVPALYNLADEVSRALKAPAIDGIVVDGRYNASFRQVGWRRRRILSLGLPLLTVLNDEEKVALVAHELAHGVNGDAARGGFIGGAVGILASWYDLLRPGSFGASGRQIYGEVGLFGMVANCVLHILARTVWIGAYALHHLLRRDSQRAEYLADHLAARVAGTAAMLSLLDKLHFGHKLEDAVQAVAFGKGNGDIADELQKQIADMPVRELERIRRVERLQTSRLDVSHPPTGYRIEFLRTRDAPVPVVTINQEESEQTMRELAALWPTIQETLIAEWRWRNLYS